MSGRGLARLCRRRGPERRERELTMQAPQEAMLLRIYTEEGKRNGDGPLYEHIVMKAREAKLAGATVLRGPMGYGQTAVLHTAKILDLSAKLPLVIEIVDAEDKTLVWSRWKRSRSSTTAARRAVSAA
jgi:PII-like signaling protein